MKIQDLNDIVSKCWEARNKWNSIGLQLKLATDDLEAIQCNIDNVDEGFKEMLKKWLRTTQPTLADLIAALKQPPVGFHDLAEKLEREGLCRSSGAATGNNSEADYLSPHNDAHDKQTRTELQSIIIRKFKILRQGFFDTLEDQTDSISRYIRYLKEFLNKDDLREPSDISEIYTIIKEHSDFKDYKVVADMIELAGSEKDKQRRKKYIEEFQAYEMQQRFKENTLIIGVGAPIFIAVLLILILHLAGTYPYNGLASPENYSNFAIGRGLEMAVDGERSNAILYTVNQSQMVTCEVVHELTGKISDCEVQETTWKNNPYEISYQPTIRGMHPLHIKVEGEHIKGSPFNVTVIRKIGAPIKIIDKITAPQGIAFNQHNETIVAEYREHRIAILSPMLHTDDVKRFGSGGQGDGQFYHPRGIAVDDDGNILVADQKNGRIQKFNSQGEYITKVNGNHETHSKELGLPVGIGIHPHTKMIYVTDIKHHRIQILHPNLNYSGSFGSYGKGDGLLNEPNDVAFDSAGNVYVADNENHRIQVFSATGQYFRKFGHFGETKGELNYPSSISIDRDDVIYVTELYNNRVSMFTLQGDFLHSFGRKGNGEGEFNHPRGIKVDKSGNIYVSDHGNDRIQVF